MSDEKKPLMPIDQRTVDFYGDELTAVLVEGEQGKIVYVPIRPICDFLGVDWRSQYQRIRRDPVLSKHFAGVVVTTTPDPKRGGGGAQQTNCLPLDYLNGWVFDINADRVKVEIRDRVIRYQEQCYRILANSFMERSFSAESPSIQALTQIREMGRAIMQMAEQQIEVERRVATTENRLDKAAVFVGSLGKRLTAVERQIRAGSLTEEQAVEIKKRVNQIALLLTEQKPDEKHYQGVYTALHEEAGVTSYKNIPPAAFAAAVEWLDNWITALRHSAGEDEDGISS
jgi:hypothetical protein